MAGAFLGAVFGLALAVAVLAPVESLQRWWPSVGMPKEQQVQAPPVAHAQPLPVEDLPAAFAAARAAAPVRTEPAKMLSDTDEGGTTADAGPAATEPSPPAQGRSDDRTTALHRWDLLYERAHKLQRSNKLAAAVDLFRETARLNPTHPAVLYDWGYALQLQGRRQDAIEKYRQVLELHPGHSYAHYNLGALLQQEGDDASALESYRRSAETRPDNPSLHLDWGRLLEGRGDLVGAAQHYRRAADLAPQSRPGMDARRRLAQIDADG